MWLNDLPNAGGFDEHLTLDESCNVNEHDEEADVDIGGVIRDAQLGRLGLPPPVINVISGSG